MCDENRKSLHVCVIGAGYVGLTTGIVLGSLGHSVTIVEKDAAKLEMLSAGKVPIFEPGLEELMAEDLNHGRLRFSPDLDQPLREADVVFVAVGTPSAPDGSADLRAVHVVSDEIARLLRRQVVLVIKSTVPIGACDAIRRRIHDGLCRRLDELTTLDVLPASGRVEDLCEVVFCPEFLREGKALLDLVHPQRIVIGTESPRALALLKGLFASIDAPILVTDRRSAEAIKYASNAFLATKISFINEIANLCEVTGANITDVAAGMGLDDRIGDRFLQAGVGYGGSCFPKDTKALLHIADTAGYEFSLLRVVIDVNERQKRRVIEMLEEMIGVLAGKRIALLGLAFKPETDDIREAPSIVVANELLSRGADPVGYDPQAAKNFAAEVPGISIADSADEAIGGADAVVLLTEWNEFLHLEPTTIKRRMRGDVLIDGRNVLDPERVTRAGLRYHGIGRVATEHRNIQDLREEGELC